MIKMQLYIYCGVYVWLLHIVKQSETILCMRLCRCNMYICIWKNVEHSQCKQNFFAVNHRVQSGFSVFFPHFFLCSSQRKHCPNRHGIFSAFGWIPEKEMLRVVFCCIFWHDRWRSLALLQCVLCWYLDGWRLKKTTNKRAEQSNI